MASTVSKGRFAEELAVRFLTEKGFEVVARNYRCRFGEIDVIFREGDQLVFCEVKAKFGPDFGLPEEEFGAQKYQRFNMTILDYLSKHPVRNENYRIDLLAMELDVTTQTARIRHHRNYY